MVVESNHLPVLFGKRRGCQQGKTVVSHPGSWPALRVPQGLGGAPVKMNWTIRLQGRSSDDL